jgi:hypothetical protein
MRVSDVAPMVLSPPTTAAPRSTNTLSPSSWFDDAAACGELHIGVDLGAASRGLSVDQHAARVLMHLCGDRDASV